MNLTTKSYQTLIILGDLSILFHFKLLFIVPLDIFI